VSRAPQRARPASPGTVVEASHERGIAVQTKKDCLVIELLQPESKKIMTASQYISGYGLVEGVSFGA
jgi:methionyl-tRNA formyltransferase